MRLSISFVLLFAAFSCFSSTASAQVGQLNGGGGGATGGGTTGVGATGGGTAVQNGGGTTTQGGGGVTTQAPGGGSANGAAAGSNAAQSFIGGFDPSSGFVGGGQQTQRNNSRQFQAITQNGVPVGGSVTNSGTPRQVPVSLKIGFSVPTASSQSQLIPRSGNPFTQVAATRPELRSVNISVVNGVAVLIGQVPTASSRRLAANIVRLRPGVKSIDNRILIATPTLKPRPVLPRS